MRVARRHAGLRSWFQTMWAGLVASFYLLIGPGPVPTTPTSPIPGGQKITLVVRSSQEVTDQLENFAVTDAAPPERHVPVPTPCFAHASAGSPASRAGGSAVVHLC